MPDAVPRRRLPVAAALIAAVTALTACTSGLSAHAGTPFTACLREVGVDLSRMGSWTRDEERDALTDPGAMACVLSDLPREQRRDVLAWAFPDVPPEASEGIQAPVIRAASEYLAAQDARDPHAITRTGELLHALGVTGAEPEGVRHALALEPHWDAAGPLYEEWRAKQDLDDVPATRTRFVEEQLVAGGALAEFFVETAEALLAAQVRASGEEG
ncbi:hypothetical protein [Microbacterium sp. JZ31]|uniref:hypothetical protein n=1 Tax=Microbacterium sp. JZ31 TaxID=1906274 RepID=UPI00193229D3|nr:hypothetical protein [Microbacterium sp. JZ31]